MATASHPLNRYLFVADNLALLRSLDNKSVDLICIDPPFAKNQTWVGNLKPPLTNAERQQELDMLSSWGIRNAEDAAEAGIDWPAEQGSAKFKDIWRWENDVHEEWVERIESDYEALAKVIDATRAAHSEGTAAYLTYMAIRMIEMHRVLKETGSVYLHCDHDANGYLRMTLDAIFGKENNRNEIAWCYSTSGRAKRFFAKKHDTILLYTRSDDGFWSDYRIPVPQKYLDSHYRQTDSEGRRCRIRVDAGKTRIYYPDEGMICNDWWEIPYINSQSSERTGYPTQKPVALAKRIILASSNGAGAPNSGRRSRIGTTRSAFRQRPSTTSSSRTWAR